MTQISLHDDFQRPTEARRPSNTVFGAIFGLLFAILGGVRSLDGTLAIAWFGAAAGFWLVTLVAPNLLGPLNNLWFHIGLRINKVVTPLLMGIIFFAVLTPMALIMRVMRKDSLRLRRNTSSDSYWLDRRQLRPSNVSMRHQF